MLKSLYKDRLNRKEYWWMVIKIWSYFIPFIIILIVLQKKVVDDYSGSVMTVLIGVPYFLIWYVIYNIHIIKWSYARIRDSGINSGWISILYIISLTLITPYSVIIVPFLILIQIIIFSKPSIATEKESIDQVPTDNPNTEKELQKSEIEIWFEKKLSQGYDKTELLQEVKKQGYPEDFVQRLGKKY